VPRRRFLRVVASGLAGAGFDAAVHARTAVAAQPGQARDAPSSYEPYGIHEFLTWRWIYKDEKEVARALQMMKDAGVQWIRTEASWEQIEPRRGEYNTLQLDRIDMVLDQANKLGLRACLYLIGSARWASSQPDHKDFWSFAPKNLDDWTRHVEMLVRRYHERVSHWEIWNEIDLPRFWKSGLAKYIECLKAAHRTIKATDSAQRVVLAGLATNGVNAIVIDGEVRSEDRVLQRLYDLGAGPLFDVFAIHSYCHPRAGRKEFAVKKVKTARQVMEANGDRDKPIWVNEIGLSTFRNPRLPAVTENEQAEELTTQYPALLALPYVEKVFWYNFRCKGTDPDDKEHNFGIVKLDMTPRPAYDAYRRMTKLRQRPGSP
jgi:hypothetical protein